MSNRQFIAVGDTTMDTFIRLKEAEVHCDIDKENCTICMRFGDKLPYEFVEDVPAVGNAANAAVAAARLGLSSALVTDVGDDNIGKKDLASLKKDGVDETFVSIHKGMKSNHHYVLWYDAERTILVKHEEYSYRFPDIGEPVWLYLSSLADHSLPYHKEIETYLATHPNIRLAFQPGTFQMTLGVEKLKGIYERANVFVCNTDEARRILKTEEEDVHALLANIRALGPKIALITDGPKGAYVSDGAETWFMPPYPDVQPPYDRTGAGDAFASTFVAMLALGKSIPEALSFAPINAMSVVQNVGAQKGLLSREALETYLSKAPTDYKPKRLS